MTTLSAYEKCYICGIKTDGKRFCSSRCEELQSEQADLNIKLHKRVKEQHVKQVKAALEEVRDFFVNIPDIEDTEAIIEYFQKFMELSNTLHDYVYDKYTGNMKF